jgi:predicted transcriptional regulator/DNA-binding XRE family transcriptional regulator
MSKNSKKPVKANPLSPGAADASMGQRLLELRLLAGLTQTELAKRLGIGQAALSRLEKRADMQVSTIKAYVEALGARLRIEAAFQSINRSIMGVFDDDRVDDDQLVLPNLPVEKYKAHRDVVLSIKPEYSSAILEGRKTVELRRRFSTQIPRGTLAFIYSTTPDRAIVGTARISDVCRKPVAAIWKKHSQHACIKKTDFDSYFAGVHEGYVLHFEDVRSLKRIVSLQELRERFSFEPPQSFLYAKPILREALIHEKTKISHRH